MGFNYIVSVIIANHKHINHHIVIPRLTDTGGKDRINATSAKYDIVLRIKPLLMWEDWARLTSIPAILFSWSVAGDEG